jgi:hypothetical protein
VVSDRMLARYLRKILSEPTSLRLYTFVDGSEESLLEVEGGGYRPAILAPSEWQIVLGSPAWAEAPVQQFVFDGSRRHRVVGTFLTDPQGGVLWVEPFEGGPLEVGRNGDLIPVRPFMKMGAIS